jgi:hypothetical protein
VTFPYLLISLFASFLSVSWHLVLFIFLVVLRALPCVLLLELRPQSHLFFLPVGQLVRLNNMCTGPACQGECLEFKQPTLAM